MKNSRFTSTQMVPMRAYTHVCIFQITNNVQLLLLLCFTQSHFKRIFKLWVRMMLCCHLFNIMQLSILISKSRSILIKIKLMMNRNRIFQNQFKNNGRIKFRIKVDNGLLMKFVNSIIWNNFKIHKQVN